MMALLENRDACKIGAFEILGEWARNPHFIPTKVNENWPVMVTPSDCSTSRKRAAMHEKGGRENKRISSDYYYQTKAKPLNFTLCQIS